MVHSHDISGARPLGDTGLFVGGFAAALDLVDRRAAEPKDFKFFFHHLAWPEGALEEQVRSERASLRNLLGGGFVGQSRTQPRAIPWRWCVPPTEVSLQVQGRMRSSGWGRGSERCESALRMRLLMLSIGGIICVRSRWVYIVFAHADEALRSGEVLSLVENTRPSPSPGALFARTHNMFWVMVGNGSGQVQ